MEARSIVVFHSLAPWGPPSRIHYCGRDYAQAGFVGAGQAKHDGEASAFTLLTRGPLWQPIYGHPASAPQRHRYGVPCAMELFMRGSDGYRSYEIEGGP